MQPSPSLTRQLPSWLSRISSIRGAGLSSFASPAGSAACALQQQGHAGSKDNRLSIEADPASTQPGVDASILTQANVSSGTHNPQANQPTSPKRDGSADAGGGFGTSATAQEQESKSAAQGCGPSWGGATHSHNQIDAEPALPEHLGPAGCSHSSSSEVIPNAGTVADQHGRSHLTREAHSAVTSTSAQEAAHDVPEICEGIPFLAQDFYRSTAVVLV
jgi:hypothetical protein